MKKQRGEEKNKRYGALCWTFIVLAILCINPISAELFQFDNVKSYDPETETITIINTFGLGRDIAELKLNTPHNNKVGAGYGKVAEFKIELFEDYNDAFGDMEFYDLRNDWEKINRDFDYKYLVTENVDVNDYGNVLIGYLPNGTAIYDYQLIGTHKELRDNWYDLTSPEFYEGELTIGIFTNVQVGDYVEWIPTIFGVKIDEWASWTQALDVDLVYSYEFDGSSGVLALNNITENTNGTITDLTRNSNGIINGGINLNEDGGDDINITGITSTTEQYTFEFWLNYTGDDEAARHIADIETGRILFDIAFLKVRLSADGTITVVQDIQSSVWTHIVGTLDAGNNNKSLWINGTRVVSATYGGLNVGGSILFDNRFSGGNPGVTGVGDNFRMWERVLTDEEITQLYNSHRSIAINVTNEPSITLNSPIDNFDTISFEITFNGTISDVSPTNVSLIINDAYLETNTSGILADYLFTKTLSEGTHTWTYETCGGGFCNNATPRTLTISKIIVNNQSFHNTTTYETARESFTSNISYTSSSWDSITASLNYDGTQYDSTQSGSGDELNFTSTILIPVDTAGIIPMYWNYTLTNTTGSYIINSTRVNQTSNSIYLVACNATDQFNDTYLNFSFKDEGNLSELDGSIPTSTFVYTLESFTVNKSLTFINVTANANQLICFNPPNRTVSTAFEIQYEAVGYQQRIINDLLDLTSTTTDRTLYLLANADGLFVTFQIINVAEQAIEGAVINATRIIEGSTQMLGQGISDAAGAVTFWLNPNFLHTINVAANGFPFFTTSLFPTQTSYTISLGSSTSGGIFDFTKGITYSLRPSGTFIDPNEIETFDFNITSSFWTIEEFGYSLENEDGISYRNATLSANGGGVTSTLNVTANETITMNAFWLITGNYTNITRSWIIYNETLDDDWSIKNFFTDLNAYIDDGLFGLDNFGLAIILFFTIFIITGVMSWRFGLTSAPAISALLFTLVAFFDVGLNMMNDFTPIEAFSNFPTIIMGLVLVATLIREGLR